MSKYNYNERDIKFHEDNPSALHIQAREYNLIEKDMVHAHTFMEFPSKEHFLENMGDFYDYLKEKHVR